MKSIMFLLSLSLLLAICQSQIPKIIWFYWNNDEMPIFQRLCYERIRDEAQKQGWQVNMIGEHSFKSYIEEIEWFEDVVSRRTSDMPAHRADLIRVCVLEEHGGVWIDLTSIVLEGFDWVNQVEHINDVINLPNPRYNTQPPQVVFFYNERLGYQMLHQDRFQHFYNNFPGYENWFIASVKKARFITEWKAEYAKYYTMDYDAVVRKFMLENIYRDFLHQDNYFMQHMAMFYLINIKQRELDESLGLFTPIQNRKSAHHFYGILALPSSDGPFAIENFISNTILGDAANCNIIEMLLKMTVPEVTAIMGGSLKYFVKVISERHKAINKVMTHLLPEEDRKKFPFDADSGEFNKYSCVVGQGEYIVKDSFIDRYLLQPGYLPEVKIPVVSVEHRQKLWYDAAASYYSIFRIGQDKEDMHYGVLVLFGFCLILWKFIACRVLDQILGCVLQDNSTVSSDLIQRIRSHVLPLSADFEGYMRSWFLLFLYGCFMYYIVHWGNLAIYAGKTEMYERAYFCQTISVLFRYLFEEYNKQHPPNSLLNCTLIVRVLRPLEYFFLSAFFISMIEFAYPNVYFYTIFVGMYVPELIRLCEKIEKKHQYRTNSILSQMKGKYGVVINMLSLLSIAHPTIRYCRLFGLYLTEMIVPAIIVFVVFLNLLTLLRIINFHQKWEGDLKVSDQTINIDHTVTAKSVFRQKQTLLSLLFKIQLFWIFHCLLKCCFVRQIHNEHLRVQPLRSVMLFVVFYKVDQVLAEWVSKTKSQRQILCDTRLRNKNTVHSWVIGIDTLAFAMIYSWVIFRTYQAHEWGYGTTILDFWAKAASASLVVYRIGWVLASIGWYLVKWLMNGSCSPLKSFTNSI